MSKNNGQKKPSYRRRKQDYRHRSQTCNRLLFSGFLAAGTEIEIRCPACGRMHVIRAPLPQVDTHDTITATT